MVKIYLDHSYIKIKSGNGRIKAIHLICKLQESIAGIDVIRCFTGINRQDRLDRFGMDR
jgi:hypothetical protein